MTPDNDMDCNEHCHVGFPNRDKCSQVLEEDRELDKENSKSVNDRMDIDILSSKSAFYAYTIEAGLEHKAISSTFSIERSTYELHLHLP